MKRINIAELRKRLGGITQAELGRRLGVNQSTVSRLEAGEMEAEGPLAIVLRQLAESARIAA